VSNHEVTREIEREREGLMEDKVKERERETINRWPLTSRLTRRGCSDEWWKKGGH